MLNTHIAQAEGQQLISYDRNAWQQENNGGQLMEDGKTTYHSFNSNEFQQGLEKLKAMGIIVGDENGDLRPTDFITRQEVASILERAYSSFEDIPRSEDVLAANWSRGIFTEEDRNLAKWTTGEFDDDNDIAQWARNSIYSMKSLDIISGYSDNEFIPEGLVSMEESVVFAFNLFDSLTLD